MPLWISWLIKIFGVNNQLPIIILVAFLTNLLPTLSELHIFFDIVYWIIFISLLTILIPNRKNFDDNTSGVIALLLLAKKCKESEINNVKFIFVDNEELGLIGSRAHRKYLEKENLILPNSKIISLDCVGVGKLPLIIRNSKSKYETLFFKKLKDEFKFCKSI